MVKMNEKRTVARILIALLAVALVFTMMPLSMGKVFAETSPTTVEGLAVDGDVGVAPLAFKDMKEMKNDNAIKGLTKKDIPYHGINRMGTELDVTATGINMEDLLTLVGLPEGALLIGVEAESTGEKPGTKMFTAEQIGATDLQGNKMMFVWQIVDGEKVFVQTVIRGQQTPEDINRSDWFTDVTKLTVKALNKPAISVKAGKKKATVKWADDPDAEQFVIMRATKKAGKYADVGTAESGKTNFTDKKAKKGKVYFYKVKAVAGSIENLSAPKKVKIK